MIGRHRILQVHAQGKPMASHVDLLAVARRTPGFTGADLANVLNEADLCSTRTDKKLIDDDVLDEAIDRSHRRTAEAHPHHVGQGAQDHGLPRGWPRPRRGGDEPPGPRSRR